MEHFLAEVWAAIAPSLQSIKVAATSWLAWRIYAGLIGTGVACGSIWFGLRQRSDALKELPIRGPFPKRIEAIQAQLAKITIFKSRQRKIVYRKLTYVLIFGFVIPSSLLLAFIQYYYWFFPGSTPFLISYGCSRVAFSYSPTDAAGFVLSQLTMGVMDSHVAVNVFSNTQSLAPERSFLPSNGGMGGVMAAYRYFIGGFTMLFLTLSRDIVWNVTNISSRHKKLVKAQNEFKSDQAPGF